MNTIQTGIIGYIVLYVMVTGLKGVIFEFCLVFYKIDFQKAISIVDSLDLSLRSFIWAQWFEVKPDADDDKKKEALKRSSFFRVSIPLVFFIFGIFISFYLVISEFRFVEDILSKFYLVFITIMYLMLINSLRTFFLKVIKKKD